MTQAKIATAKDVCFFAKESTFGVLPGSMKPLIIEADSHEGSMTRTALDDMDSSPLLMDARSKVDGLFEVQDAPKFSSKLKPFATQIISSVPVTQPALFDALECSLGGMHCGTGGTISAGTTTSVTVSSVSGFRVGEVVGISGAGDVQLAVCESFPGGGVVNIWPSLGSAVTSGNVVKGYNAYTTDTNTLTASYQHAYPDDAGEQQEFRGCIVKTKLTSDLNSLAMLAFELMPAAGQQGALSLSTAVQSNPLVTGGFAIRNALLYVQTSATTTRVNYCVESFSLEYDPGIEFTPCLTGTEGKDGVMRTKGRELAKLMLKIKADTDEITAWSARTVRRVLFAIPSGSGTTKRWIYVYLPRAVLARQPKQVKEGGRLLYELEFQPQIDSTAAAGSLAGASLVIGAL